MEPGSGHAGCPSVGSGALSRGPILSPSGRTEVTVCFLRGWYSPDWRANQRSGTGKASDCVSEACRGWFGESLKF